MYKGEPFLTLVLYPYEPENQAGYALQGLVHFDMILAQITKQVCILANFQLNFFAVLGGKLGEFFYSFYTNHIVNLQK